MCLKRSAASVLLSCALLFPAAAQTDTPTTPPNNINAAFVGGSTSQPLFYINEKPIATAEFIYLYRKNHQHKPEDFTREKIEEYLELFINYKLKVEEALARGMDTTAAFKKEYQTYRDELLKPHLPDAKVIDSLVVLTYDRLREEINASHVLIRLKPDATPEDTLEAFTRISALRKRTLAGEDFGVLAAEFSEEPGAATTKGNLGYFTAMQMVFPFEQAAYLTPVGDVSEPVRTQFGYHIIKVLDRQPSRGEVEISHIMIRAKDAGGEEAARNSIFDIYDKLQKGMKWDELCAQYSDDLNTRESGGKLRPFGVGTMGSMPGFQNMAFSLKNPGDISDPVRTQYGWHILKLESKIPLPPFEELKPSLTQRVSGDERVKISREALRERMRKEFKYDEREGVIAILRKSAGDITRNQTLPSNGLSDSTLFSMAGRTFSVRSFLDFVKANPVSAKSATQAGQRLDDLINEYADEMQIRLLEEKVKSDSPDYGWLLKEYYEGILLFEIMEGEVWNRAMEDSTGQRNYFAANAEKYNQKLPPGPQTFEEARASVISDYQSFLEDSWIRELKRKFVVKVEKRAKKRAFAQLMDQRDK